MLLYHRNIMLQELYGPPLPIPDHSAADLNNHLGELLPSLTGYSMETLSHCTQRRFNTYRLSCIRFIVTFKL
jgi:hypothetical protein